MKNAALVYSGQIRNFKECYATHLKHIINVNPDFKFHIFAHFWNDPSLYGKQYWEQYPERGTWGKDNIEEFFACQPEMCLFEKPILFQSNLIPDPRFPHPIQNLLSMFYSILNSGMVMDNYSRTRNIKFDAVFRMRTDLFFVKNFILSNYDLNNLWVGQQYMHMPYAVNDQFSFGSQEQMAYYFNTFNHITSIVNNKCAINPECILGFHLNSIGAKLAKTPLQYTFYDLFRFIKNP